MLGILAKLFNIIDTASEKVGKFFSYLILIMVALEAFEVFMRYALDSPTTWSWELVTLLYGAHFIVGGAWVLKEEGHVRTDIIYAHLSPKWKAVLNVITYACLFFVFMGVMIWKQTTHAYYSWSIDERTYTMWGPPFWPLKIFIAFSFILLGLQGIVKWLRNLIFLIKGEEV